MRVKQLNVEFANFVCHFGEQTLLERYSDIFYPAMISGRSREYGDTSMSLLNVQHLEIDDEDTGESRYFLYGKVVKDWVYKREQILEDGQLKQIPDELQDSPSSIFMLSLTDHRLYFVREFQFAPTLDNFKQLVKKLVDLEINQIISGIIDDKKKKKDFYGGNGKVPSKKELLVNYPKPDIDIVHLSSEADIEAFVRNMKTINKVTLKLVKPNHEFSCTELFEVTREQTERLGSDAKSRIDITKGKKSLVHDNVVELAKSASKDSNIAIELHGRDAKGGKIDGTDEDFQVKVPISEIEDSPILMTKKAFETFKDLVKAEVIDQPRIKSIEKVKEKIRSIMEILK